MKVTLRVQGVDDRRLERSGTFQDVFLLLWYPPPQKKKSLEPELREKYCLTMQATTQPSRPRPLGHQSQPQIFGRALKCGWCRICLWRDIGSGVG